MLYIDGAIIAALVYNLNTALYAIISQIIVVIVIDTVVFGFGSKKVKLEIISNHSEEITEYIIHTIKTRQSKVL